MSSFVPLSVCCISLMFLQLLALPHTHTDRSDFFDKLIGQREKMTFALGRQTNNAVPTSAPDAPLTWPSGVQKHAPASGARFASPGLEWARPLEALQVDRSPLRARRHAHAGSRGGHHYQHHPQLMRVGCVLGTCQVQNLSHRLYQLIGQSGREDSSPINPKSPHSYG